MFCQGIIISLIADIENFNSLTKHYQSIDCSVFDFIVPQKEKLLSLSQLKEYRKIANDLVQKYSSKEEHFTINCKDYPELRKQLQSLYKLFSEIENNIFPFKAKLISDFRNNLFLWKDKLSRTNNSLTELPDEKLKQLDRSVEINYPTNKSLIQLKSDAQSLLSYMNEGNALSGILFNLKKALLPKNIKEKLYFIEGVKVNGSPCDTAAEFQTVLEDIKIKQDFEELEIIWEIKANGNSKSYFDKSKFYRQLKEETETLISLLQEANKIKEQIEIISSVRIQDYESRKVNELIDETDYNSLLAQAKAFKEIIVEANNYFFKFKTFIRLQ